MESCSSPSSQGCSWPVHATGIRPTSLLIFISDHHLCEPVITASASLPAVLECTGDGNLSIWAGAKAMEPPRHPSLKARNKHQEKAAKELCLCFLCHTEARPEVQTPPSGNRAESARRPHVSWAPSYIPPVPRNATSHDRCTRKTARKSQIHISLTQFLTLRS